MPTYDLNPGLPNFGTPDVQPTRPAAPAPAAPAAPTTPLPELPPGAVRLSDGTIWQPTVDQQRLDAEIKRDAAELKRKQDEFAATEQRIRDLAAEQNRLTAQGQAQDAQRIAIERQRAEAEIAWRKADLEQRQADLTEKKRQFDVSLPIEVAKITGTYGGQETLPAREIRQRQEQFNADLALRQQLADQERDLRTRGLDQEAERIAFQRKEVEARIAQEQADLAERQRQFNTEQSGVIDGQETLDARNARLDREQRDRAQYSDTARALLDTASRLRGPEDYFQYQQFLGGGRSLMDQLYGSQAPPAFGAPTQASQPASLAGILQQLGISGLPGQQAQPGQPGQAAGADQFIVPLPHQINPAVWDAMNPTARALVRSAAAAGKTQGGAYDPQDYERQIDATRPKGQVARKTSYQYAPVAGAYS